IARAPRAQVARLTSVLGVVQSVTLMLTNPLLGGLAQATNARLAVVVSALPLLVAAAVVARQDWSEQPGGGVRG
ncbi:hypothetical protein, partial [Actinophytocola sp.]|uniref:hypothetical protein n=1 Tax=Actinophytocola sp. TaxID=1872138 RepID=UPI002D802855